ncbi:MAG: alpha/beta hydrolase [Melioribacteraceae bacterium]|nr:MAG: alpha/beta hydrolase [Melioribacteraceae bacterium]
MKLRISFFAVIIFSIIVFRSENIAEEGKVKSNDGIEISYSVNGEGDVALVFVHGWSCDKSYWKNQVDEFAEEYKVVTVDLAGHGDSGNERADYKINFFGEDVASVITTLGLNKVVLIGHSMGGAVIFETYGFVSPRVLGLIGIDTYQGLTDKYPEEQTNQFIQPFKDNFVEAAKGFVKSMFPPSADSVLAEKIADDMSQAPQNVALSAIENLFRYENPELLAQINVPVISINGDLFPTNYEENKKVLPTYELKIINNCGHFPMFEKTEEFNKILKETIVELTSK